MMLYWFFLFSASGKLTFAATMANYDGMAVDGTKPNQICVRDINKDEWLKEVKEAKPLCNEWKEKENAARCPWRTRIWQTWQSALGLREEVWCNPTRLQDFLSKVAWQQPVEEQQKKGKCPPVVRPRGLGLTSDLLWALLSPSVVPFSATERHLPDGINERPEKFTICCTAAAKTLCKHGLRQEMQAVISRLGRPADQWQSEESAESRCVISRL